MTTSKGGQSGGGKKGQRSRKTDRRDPNAEQIKADPVKAESVKAESVEAESVQSAEAGSLVEHLPDPNPIVAQAEAAVSQVAKPVEVLLSGEVIPPDTPIGGDRPSGIFPPAVEAIAKAYGDYVRQSFQTNRSLVERLVGARSFEEAISVQAEFARQAYDNFVAESLKLCGLYGELARQMFRPFGGSAATITHVRRRAH